MLLSFAERQKIPLLLCLEECKKKTHEKLQLLFQALIELIDHTHTHATDELCERKKIHSELLAREPVSVCVCRHTKVGRTE